MLLPPEIMQQWLELSQRGIHCFPHFFLYHKIPRIAVFYPNKSNAYTPYVDPVVKMFIGELLPSSKIIVARLITDGPIGIRGIPKCRTSEIGDLNDIDAVVIPERAMYDNGRDLLQQINPLLKVFWLGDIITDIYNVAVVSAPLVSTLFDLAAKGHDVLFVLAPTVEDIEERSPYENWLAENNLLNGGIRRVLNTAFPMSGLKEKYTFEQYRRISGMPLSIIPRKNYHVMADCRAEDYTIINNIRLTVGSPEKYDFHVHVFGNSAGLGAFLADEDTSSSFLQSIINQRGISACVINHCMDAAAANIVSARIQDTVIRDGDKIVVIMPKSGTASVHTDYYAQYYIDTLRSNGIAVLAAKDFFQRPHSLGEVFLDARHLNPTGNKRLGEIIFDVIFPFEEKNVRNRIAQCVPFLGISEDMPKTLPVSVDWFDLIAESQDFRVYIQNLKSIRERYAKNARLIGAIVVNCNPFTMGHRYLIEHAAANTDFLYVLVVEEDRSVFPFEDRIALVDKGIADLPNVGVMASGRFIISTLTFPEYFVKGEYQGAHIDPTTDVELFGQYIAPALGITLRFAGTEPNDTVTRQYNETMSVMLPRYGVAFREIERVSIDGQPISASRVRRLLKSKSFNEIEKMVPPTTLEYLRQRN